jgi:prenylcysteine oxidase / farnesylcysteine lyase
MDPEYVSLPSSSLAPTTVLTTYQGVREGGKAPEFNSLSYQRKIGDNEWVVKIFSEEAISDEWLNNTFFGQVGWVYRKEVRLVSLRLSRCYADMRVGQWDAYPRLFPTTTFPSIKLDDGFYYVNAFEP